MQTPLWTAVGAVPLLADRNTKIVGWVESPSQAVVVPQARESLLTTGDAGTIAASWRDKLPRVGITFDRSSRM